MVRDSSDSFPRPSRLRALTAALGLTSPISREPATTDTTDPPVTRNERAVTTSSYPTHGGFTLHLRVHSANKLPAVTQGSYCKLYVGKTPIVGGFGEGKTLASLKKKAGGRTPPTHRTFHTKVQLAAQKDSPEWNEKFQVNVFNPTSEILTIRVKNQVLVYSPVIGACTVHLRQLCLGETVDNWFPLLKNDKPAGSIRLQMCLQADDAASVPTSSMARDSGVSEETIQRLVREHREQQASIRREMEIQQQEKWKRMEEEELRHIGLQSQMLREEHWREECNRRAEQQEQEKQREEDNTNGDSGSDVAQHHEKLDVEAEEAVASKLMGELNLRGSTKGNQRVTEPIVSKTIDDSGDVKDNNARLERRTSNFGTIRLSVEELDQVVQDALPSSDSSESTSSEEEFQRRKHRHREKCNRQRRKRSQRRFYRGESSASDSHSHSSTDDCRGISKITAPHEKQPRRTMFPSASSRSGMNNQSNQNQPQRCSDTPLSLTFPPSSSDGSSSDIDRRRRHYKTKKPAKREKHKSHSTRKHKKNRRNYESSDSSLPSFSSSEEERLRRKLKKKKARKAREKIRSLKSFSRTSRDPMGIPDVNYGRNSQGYAEPGGSDYWYLAADQHWPDNNSVGTTQPKRGTKHHLPENIYSSVSTTSQQDTLLDNTENDVEGIDSGPIKPMTTQYLGQETTERGNASFCF